MCPCEARKGPWGSCGKGRVPSDFRGQLRPPGVFSLGPLVSPLRTREQGVAAGMSPARGLWAQHSCPTAGTPGTPGPHFTDRESGCRLPLPCEAPAQGAGRARPGPPGHRARQEEGGEGPKVRTPSAGGSSEGTQCPEAGMGWGNPADTLPSRLPPPTPTWKLPLKGTNRSFAAELERGQRSSLVLGGPCC